MISVISFILGTSLSVSAQMQEMMGRRMNRSTMSEMPMCGLGMAKMIAAEDNGVIVMSHGKLYKYDKDLNLKKEVKIPVDFDHIKQMRMKMKDTWMMEDGDKK